STMKLWNSLDSVQALQTPTDQSQLRTFVLKSLTTMYDSFEIDRKGMDKNQIIDIRYEELTADPIQVVGDIYSQLDLGSFEPVKQKLVEKTQKERDYQTNRLELSREDEESVLRAWHAYALHYGYL
ncbi:MAG: sulfotransferase, partial [Planctomycetes bacterium]|nr:sulfotransferase [Planctomycetota bacterium]